MIDPFSIGCLSLSASAGLLRALCPTPDNTKLLGRLVEYLAAPDNRRILARVVWVASVVILLGLSAAAIFVSNVIWAFYKPGITVTVVLWSLFLGTTASLVLPSKVIVATFGGLIGVTLSEVGTAAGLISTLRQQITEIAIEFGAIASPGSDPSATPNPYFAWMIWLFVGIMALLCLPAFFEKENK